MHETEVSRRTFVRTAAGIWILASGGHLFGADCPPTPPNVAGPYWREGSPFRTRLWTDEPGEILSIRGTITDADCRPVAASLTRRALSLLWAGIENDVRKVHQACSGRHWV